MEILEEVIKNNLFKLNITTSPTVIFHKICKFLSRARDSEIEKENDENEAINLFKQAAFKGDEDAIDFCEKNNIEYPISEKNYLRIFKSALKLHKSRNKCNNKIEVEVKNCKLFTELYNNKYYELDSTGEVAYWIVYYSLKGYGSDTKLSKDVSLELLKLAAERGYNQAIEYCERKKII
ncbi:hypothetical protein F8M41_008903 [Gigaspora margarita]|uniref:Uncharacterized protein n=1 Tax=Gigaspora margarita TaxID=4874 RepID=A0A8H4A3B2_GIGMA|nr:hypothetical protein F8M41_008903 [Gigaspora margarita]